MLKATSGVRGGMLRVAAIALIVVAPTFCRAQSGSPFGSNDPSERTAATVGTLRSNMIGRQAAVSAEIVHNTPDRLDAVYNHMYFNNQARLYSVGAHGSAATAANQGAAMALDHLAYNAILARNTREYVTRSRGGYLNPGGLTGPPGADLLLSSPQAVKQAIVEDTLPDGWSVTPAPPTGTPVVPGVAVAPGFIVAAPIGVYRYYFAPA